MITQAINEGARLTFIILVLFLAYLAIPERVGSNNPITQGEGK